MTADEMDKKNDNGGWSFRQRFQLRAGTMLLLFTGALIAIGTSDYLFEGFTALFPRAGRQLWRFGVNIERYLVAAALFSLGFLVHSIVRREPQVQFIVELLICLMLYKLL